MSFIYFIPGREKITLFGLAEVGLGYLFRSDESFACRPTWAAGPSGSQGVIVTPDGLGGYHPKKQTWADWGDFWIGYETLPTPDELARTSQISGDVIFDGERTWLIPKLRDFYESQGEIHCRGNLPERLEYNRDLKEWLPGGVQKDYEKVWKLANDYMQAICDVTPDDDGLVHIQFPEVDELAVLGFGVNYRMGIAELNAFGSYSTDLRSKLIDILIDVDGYNDLCNDLIKKKTDETSAQDGGDSAAGPSELT